MLFVSDPEAIFDALHELRLLQKDLPAFLGSSLRTVQRHIRTGGLSSPEHVKKMVVALHPQNPALAKRVAAAAGTTLEAMGIVAPPSASAAASATAAPPALRREHLDSVLCAAADALEITPSAAKAGVVAAFARALELGVDLPSLARAFASVEPTVGRSRPAPATK